MKEEVFPPATVEALLCGTIFNKNAFFKGEKQGMLYSN